MTIDQNKSYTATIRLQKGGEIKIQLLPKDAPNAVNNFVFLARNRFYEGLTFHRVIANFVAQGGDPKGDGTGDSGYKLQPDKSTVPMDAGAISMAQSAAGISGSQFFITLTPQPSLSPQFTVFGKVIAGMDVVQKITLRDPSKGSQPPGDVIASITIAEGN
jgi:peptidylprolyl isomerase